MRLVRLIRYRYPNTPQFLRNMLATAPPRPGPPWTHTITGPEIIYTKRGKVLYIPPPAPAYTLVIR